MRTKLHRCLNFILSNWQRSILKLLLLTVIGFATALLISCNNSNSQSRPTISLSSPIQCTNSENCFILLYSDRDPSEQATDFDCGTQTYDGHKGTDFAIPDAETMNKGVPVVASASGTVLRVRDGVIDKRVTDQSSPEIQGIECGNGVVIDHGDGWQTQYCHLRQGSVQVESGDEVKTGDQLGLVGMSGLASFPHVHLQVTYNEQIVDPFVGVNEATGCQVKKEPLWAEAIPYTPTGLIRAGFSTQVPQLDELWAGKFSATSINGSAPALIFWIQSYGVAPDDVESIELIGPQGTIVAQTSQKIDRRRKVWLRYTGKKANNAPLLKGEWQGKYQLKRGEKILIDVTKNVSLQ